MKRITVKEKLNKLLPDFSPARLFFVALGAAICSFGVCNIHRVAEITEGGVLGLVLLLDHWIELPPSVSSPLLDILCYLFAFLTLGGGFIRWSAVGSVFLALSYRVWESLPQLMPDLSARPVAAAVVGALFVGVGVGLVTRAGSSCGGDDALALSISRLTGKRLSVCYLFTDLTVLALSLTYIPPKQIFYSLITVVLSSTIIDFIKSVRVGERDEETGEIL